jgi:hypothetical protein
VGHSWSPFLTIPLYFNGVRLGVESRTDIKKTSVVTDRTMCLKKASYSRHHNEHE